MNKKAKQVMDFLENNPAFKGSVVGYKGSRGGIGITRVDNDWYECDFYLLELTDRNIELISTSPHTKDNE